MLSTFMREEGAPWRGTCEKEGSGGKKRGKRKGKQQAESEEDQQAPAQRPRPAPLSLFNTYTGVGHLTTNLSKRMEEHTGVAD